MEEVRQLEKKFSKGDLVEVLRPGAIYGLTGQVEPLKKAKTRIGVRVSKNILLKVCPADLQILERMQEA